MGNTQQFDLVISGGRVVDPETELEAVRNVGITDGQIAAVSEDPLEGVKTLDATGHIVAPGFIDIHSHAQQLPAAWVQAFDGVTTALELESGLLPVDVAYERMAKEGRPINYGLGSAWSFARVQVLQPKAGKPDGTLKWFQNAFSLSGWQTDVPSPEQLEQIIDLVEEGLNQGGIGVSVNAGYAPGMGRKEYYELAKLAFKHGVATFTHDRYMSTLEPRSSFEALGEQIGLAAITGAHMHICHINSVCGRDLDDATELLQRAESRNIPITVEAYTYGALCTAIGAEFFRGPEWLTRFGGDEYSAMELRGKALTKEKIEELQSSGPGSVVVFHFLHEEEEPDDMKLLDKAVLYPGGAIASDCTPWSDANGAFLEGEVWPLPDDAFSHPRSAGCFSRLFAIWVRERQVLSLLDAVRKTTLIPAQVLEEFVPQMKKKGRLQVGCDADVIVFDLNTIKDNATFVAPAQLSSGQRHVVVNGVPIIEEGERIGDAKPGRPIRRQV
ncbi:amidohydrolase family protein [Marinobacter sp. F4206]|uniref:amidohydrolase family protein n=1 Tax=Marinobacter sp. F4206 TaxID=2861777 RepID=UPI001C5D7C18|nr:amidohydrolase family protein [Marinobacter sp. F4206]MBW4936030.1 amidohydrolase family protein [Marinobacter sp. F4206]